MERTGKGRKKAVTLDPNARKEDISLNREEVKKIGGKR